MKYKKPKTQTKKYENGYIEIRKWLPDLVF